MFHFTTAIANEERQRKNGQMALAAGTEYVVNFLKSENVSYDELIFSLCKYADARAIIAATVMLLVCAAVAEHFGIQSAVYGALALSAAAVIYLFVSGMNSQGALTANRRASAGPDRGRLPGRGRR